MTKSRRNRRAGGFTLIELLLVVVIIGILAAIVVPRLTGRTVDAQIGAAKQQISGFSNALKMYELDNGFFPSVEQGLAALVTMPAGEPQPKKWRKYLDSMEVPVDPWGNMYDYAFPGVRDPDSFDIRSRGPDGQPDTPDDIWKP